MRHMLPPALVLRPFGGWSYSRLDFEMPNFLLSSTIYYCDPGLGVANATIPLAASTNENGHPFGSCWCFNEPMQNWLLVTSVCLVDLAIRLKRKKHDSKLQWNLC
jgi:hypothetical protein